jgi:hypothetical protein
MLELNSYHAILASVTTGKSAGVMPRSVYELMTWPSGTVTHVLGEVDTLLIHKNQERLQSLEAFRDVLLGPNNSLVTDASAISAT